ncbi:MAG: phosphoribosylformylglycinamidine cyclo-ligase [Thermomicrobiales bacterium]
MVIPTTTRPRGTYQEAGVDIDRASEAVAKIAGRAKQTFGLSGGPGIGHFGGVYRLAGSDRCLVASADGVGTKLKLAFVLGGDAHAGVGRDLVHHCVNDVMALGARPLFFLDYIAMGRLEPDVVEGVVSGMISACGELGMVLLGGETAEMPGLYSDGEYDAAGFIVGEVDVAAVIDGSSIEVGDVLVGLRGTGLHTNGYSLVRRILGLTGSAVTDRPILDARLPNGNGASLGEALMQPHQAYWRQLAPLLETGWIHGMAHITGGGIIDNVPRMLPDGMGAVIEQERWNPGPLFTYLLEQGNIALDEAYRVFNMGIGFVLAVSAGAAGGILQALPDALVIGHVTALDSAVGEWDRIAWRPNL